MSKHESIEILPIGISTPEVNVLAHNIVLVPSSLKKRNDRHDKVKA